MLTQNTPTLHITHNNNNKKICNLPTPHTRGSSLLQASSRRSAKNLAASNRGENARLDRSSSVYKFGIRRSPFNPGAPPATPSPLLLAPT